jgi:hypothetical protein
MEADQIGGAVSQLIEAKKNPGVATGVSLNQSG